MRTISAFLCGLMFALLSWAGETSTSAPVDKIYSFGVLPHFEARRLHAIWRPILDAIEKETGLRFTARIGNSISSYEQDIISGMYDFAYMGPYHQVVSEKTAGYIPLVRDVGANIYGILVVRKDDPIRDIKELDGKIVALPAPNAIAASMMIRADLENKYGVKIIPRYVHTHDSVYLNVVLGQAAAGGTQQKTLAEMRPEIRDQLRVFYKTQEVTAHPISAHPRVPADIRKRVQDAILKLAQTDEGRSLFAAIPYKKVGIATFEDYELIRRMGLQRFQD